jgi:hypothetical protein
VIAILAYAFGWGISHAQSPSLPTDAKRRILKTAAEALKAGDITAAQHAELVHWTSIEPCKNVRMKVSKARELGIASAVSEVQGFPNSKVLAYFETKGWYIVFTNASPGDEQYLVYDRDPVSRAKPRTSWSGAATMFETNEIRDWLLSSAPQVPRRLAECFAWQGTLGQ